MLAQKTEHIPVTTLKFYLAIDDVKETTAAQSEWITPFENGPLAILEDLFDKTARAGKRPVRDRMTILKELRQLNEENLQRVDLAKKTALIAMYGKRIRALGANLTDEEREADKKTPA